MSAAPISLPLWVDRAVLPILNVCVAFLMAGLVVLFIGESPWEAIRLLLAGALGSAEAFCYTLTYSTAFTLAGLAVAVAYHAGLFNIGVEGQAVIGGITTLAVAQMLESLPDLMVLPLAVMAAALGGAVYGAVPGWLQARRGSHIVITTIMFNFIAFALLNYLLVEVFRPEGSMEPASRYVKAQMPFLHDLWLLRWAGMPKSPLTLFLPLTLLGTALIWLLVYRSKLGFALRTVGANPIAARYAGISPEKITIVAMALSGALAGIMAAMLVLGPPFRLLLGFTGGYGFVGIAVALMGRGHPLGILCAALLFGILYQGGTELSFDKPAITRDMIVVIQGLVILFAGAMEYLFRPLLARLFKMARPS